MFKTFTFVKMRLGFSRDDFFDRWCQNTRDFVRQSHAEIEQHRLMLIDGEGPFVGLAETHWKEAASLDRAIAYYETPAGRVFWKDLQVFMDAESSPTFVVTHEANLSTSDGVDIYVTPGKTP
jgi:hypothetical protein